MIHVSADGGEVWNMAQLPKVNHEQFYSILAANQDMIFMHVDNPGGQKPREKDTGAAKGSLWGSKSTSLTQCIIQTCVYMCLPCWPDSGVGTIYVSDDRGAVFSKSLERHLYTTTSSDTDFTAITSLRGVYMTSVLTEGGSAHYIIYVLTQD